MDVDQLFTDWADAVRRKDAASLAAMVTDDCEFWTHGLPALKGREAVDAAFRKAFSSPATVAQRWDEIERLSGDGFIVSVGIERSHVTLEGSEPTITARRGWTLAKRGSDGRWRFARGTTNQES